MHEKITLLHIVFVCLRRSLAPSLSPYACVWMHVDVGKGLKMPFVRSVRLADARILLLTMLWLAAYGSRTHAYCYSRCFGSQGSVPIGWAVDAELSLRFPVIFPYLYATATQNDVIISGDSGAGYLNPTQLLPPRAVSNIAKSGGRVAPCLPTVLPHFADPVCGADLIALVLPHFADPVYVLL